MSKLYGIGVGVGEPEMITIKAVNTLKKIDVVILPNAGREFSSTAYGIAKEYLKEGIEFIDMEFSMNPDVKQREIERKQNAKAIEEHLDRGLNVGFITIGDPMTYSTYVYILEYLDEKYQVETIPGISSFVDIASRVNIPLVIGDESLKVIGLYRKCDRDFIIKHIEENDNLVVMKASLKFEELKEALKITGNENNVVLVCDSGKPNQRVYFDIMGLKKDEIPYFSTLILKKGGIEKWKKFIS